MKAKSHPAQPRRWILLGPGTVMAMVAALYLIGSGWLSSRRQNADTSSRVVYQADTLGHLKKVEAPFEHAVAPGSPRRLYKPEVGSLLDQTQDLHLQPSQQRRITALAVLWSRDKADLAKAMQGATSGVVGNLENAHPGRGAAVALVQHDLGDYSALSRQYDARRADYWLRGLAILTPKQRERAETSSQPAQGATR